MDIFSKIAAGEIPSYKCAENEKFYAFLDINPLAKGHTLVIPRREVDYIFDMDDDELAEFQLFAKQVAVALKKCGVLDAKTYYAYFAMAEEQGIIHKEVHPDTGATWVELVDNSLPF